MKWLKNKLRSWVFEVEEESGRHVKASRAISGSHSRTLETRGMNFTVYHASGGHVLEYNQYDEKTDRHYNRLHIIPTDQDLGQGISHIITLEMLRK